MKKTQFGVSGRRCSSLYLHMCRNKTFLNKHQNLGQIQMENKCPWLDKEGKHTSRKGIFGKKSSQYSP